MHIPGRSTILDTLYAQSKECNEPVHYDIRSLSKEILMRSNKDTFDWLSEKGDSIVLRKSSEGDYDYYELWLRCNEDPDVHRYVYNSINGLIRYEYPLFTWQKDKNAQESREQIEKILLGLMDPMSDKVPDTHVESVIQQSFVSIAGKLVMEHLADVQPDIKSDAFKKYLSTDDKEERKAIIKDLYDTSTELKMFSVSPAQFDFAFYLDLSRFCTQQKQLMRKNEDQQ